jgi:hypothetical protein
VAVVNFEVKLEEVTGLLVDGLLRFVEKGSVEYSNDLVV